MGEVTSLDKSVFFWTQKVSPMGMGGWVVVGDGGFRDENLPNLANGILKAIGNFETDDKLGVLGTIAIRVGDLIISGCDLYVEHFSKNEGEIRCIAMGGISRPIWGGNQKVSDSDFDGLVSESNDYEEK